MAELIALSSESDYDEENGHADVIISHIKTAEVGMENRVYEKYMIYLLTAIGLSPGGNSTVHIYTQTTHRTIQNKQYIEQHNNFGRVWAVPRLGWLYIPWHLPYNRGKSTENPSQGSRV